MIEATRRHIETYLTLLFGKVFPEIVNGEVKYIGGAPTDDARYSVNTKRSKSLSRLVEIVVANPRANVAIFWDVLCDAQTYDEFMIQNDDPRYGVVDGLASFTLTSSMFDHAQFERAADHMMFQDFVIAVYENSHSVSRRDKPLIVAITAFDGEGFVLIELTR